jgi:hypothetical protein
VAVHRRPVTARDRAGQLEAVVDRPAHQGREPGRRRARSLEELGRDPVQRDEVVRRDRRTGVVERTRVVCEVERLEAEQLGKPPADVAALRRLRHDRRVGVIELLGPALVRERLQRVQPEAAHMRVECRQRGRTARVRDPGPRLDPLGDLGDCAVGHAEEDELGSVLAQREAALAQPSAHCGTDAS